ncbi:phosphoribosyltransferase [Herbaspirillum sp. RTI4]|uniref:phosphoribosyltransferase n=1 Tax=Herbaspirillum sp. RTI4 TaxID=3048640 RepID=UPI002AB4270D|nr:phosphoribosyltransferase [Herbaspirillum sp. RTI4]MDY7578620.1 phosphoribosyltransferase [Herbaspirillum sp. RTI4]MEA9981074.1 phosphoribosyltransferase [Herbaspirillum sp. RTI4]
MKISDDKDLWISWEQYHRSIEQLALKVHASDWRFDQVLCLARGGLRPGDVFSRIFDVPLAILSTSSYRESAGTVRGDLDIAKYITITKGSLGGRILLVDDLVDSGVTLQRVQTHLKEHYPAVTEVKSAVIWWKACSVVEPDYYGEHLPTNPWIHQPFEDYDGLGPHQLAAWIKKGESPA